MKCLESIKITTLMDRTSGKPEIKIGFIDGPVFSQHPDFIENNLHEIPGGNDVKCTKINSTACMHGTFVAGILSAKRSSVAPGICPHCTLLIRPIFSETSTGNEHMPSATPQELAKAIIECINSGARVINLSLALTRPYIKGEKALEEALDHAIKRDVLVVAAAGNQGTLGSTAITSHPWVIPVVACDLRGKPMNESNLGSSIGRRGLCAPGEGITSLGTEGKPLTFGGTSVAVPFVTGTIALLWSEFLTATAAQIKLAVTQSSTQRRFSVVPPLLDAAAAYQMLSTMNLRR